MQVVCGQAENAHQQGTLWARGGALTGAGAYPRNGTASLAYVPHIGWVQRHANERPWLRRGGCFEGGDDGAAISCRLDQGDVRAGRSDIGAVLPAWLREDVDRGQAGGAVHHAGITAISRQGVECLSVSASLEQSRIMLGFVREALGDREDDYRWLDSSQRLTVTHKETRTRLRILSSSGKRAMGLAQFSTIFADEPGSWETRGGRSMWDALRQSLGEAAGATPGADRHAGAG